MNATDDAPEAKRKSSLGTRVLSLAALCGVVVGVGSVANTVYRIATDGFVAPVILSPDSDMVIQSKLSMSQLLAERTRITSKRDALDEEIQGGDASIEELKTILATATKGLAWTTSVTRTELAAGKDDQTALGLQKGTLAEMLVDEQAFLDMTRKDLEGGLVSKAEYARERAAMNQLRVAAIENERSRIASETRLSQARLTQQAMGAAGARFAPPELLAQQNEMVRVRCDIIRLQAERRSKVGERRSLDEELVKLDELLGQLKARPIFRAIEANTNVAFIPYTQIEGVRTGTPIYDCIWGVFACKAVGRVAELLPGEALVQDPWGSPARGQYAIIDLRDQQAAQSKTLRVRPGGTPEPAHPREAPVVAKK